MVAVWLLLLLRLPLGPRFPALQCLGVESAVLEVDLLEDVLGPVGAEVETARGAVDELERELLRRRRRTVGRLSQQCVADLELRRDLSDARRAHEREEARPAAAGGERTVLNVHRTKVPRPAQVGGTGVSASVGVGENCGG